MLELTVRKTSAKILKKYYISAKSLHRCAYKMCLPTCFPTYFCTDLNTQHMRLFRRYEVSENNSCIVTAPVDFCHKKNGLQG